MQQHDAPDKRKHELANIQRENTHTLRSWYGSGVGNRTNIFAVKFVKKFFLTFYIFFSILFFIV